MRPLETRGSRGNLLDRLCVQAQLLERSTLHLYLYFSHKQAFILISQREQDEAKSAICVHVCLPVLICVVGQVCLFIHTYCTHAFVRLPTGNTAPASSLLKAGCLKLCLFGDLRFGNLYEPVLTF